MSKSIDKIIEAIDKKIERLKGYRSEILRIAAAADLEDVFGEGPVRGTLRNKAKRPERPVNEKSLRLYALEILEKKKKGLTLDELKDAVLSAGYVTTSKHFKSVLAQCLRSSSGFVEDTETGKFFYSPE